MMIKSLVLTVLGADRPGLVEALAAVVADKGGNWVESRFTRLAGQFAGVLRVDVPAERVADIESAMAALGEQGLRVTVHVSEHDADAGSADRTLRLALVGLDRPGIVHEVARALAAGGVNVTSLETDLTSAPMTGDPLFKAIALLSVPVGQSDDALRHDLERVAELLDLDLDLEEAVGRP